MRSPENTATSLALPKVKATWPGVWPGVGRMRTWSPIPWSLRHDLGLPGFDDRQHAVTERRHGRLGVLLGPVVELASGEDVARLRKGRHPASVFQPGVPSDMIDMQMRAHHEIDVADRKAGGLQRPHIGVVGLHVPFRAQRPRLVVADAAIDQDGVMRRLHDVGLETQDQHVVVVDRTGLFHPRPVLREPFRRQAGQQVQRRQERGFLLDNAMNGEVAGSKFEAHELLP